uniref:Putative ovule protein n=1 Tax=Solanum chacoense TaxID=4108 RepID=A0A0V0HCK9_SOLCH
MNFTQNFPKEYFMLHQVQLFLLTGSSCCLPPGTTIGHLDQEVLFPSSGRSRNIYLANLIYDNHGIYIYHVTTITFSAHRT